jgi:hypothetical protein
VDCDIPRLTLFAVYAVMEIVGRGKNMNEHYSAVIADLNARRKPIMSEIDSLTKQLGQLDSLIAGIKTHGGSDEMYIRPQMTVHIGWEADTYTDMSMRWAIMYMLAEHTQKQLPTAEIGPRLIAGGFVESPNFNSKVSAILSQMQGKNEVSRSDEGWGITTAGRDVWKNIKSGDKFITRHSSGKLDLDLE